MREEEEEEEEEDERKWATREIHIWRHYKKEAEMLRAANTEGRVRDFALSCESASSKGGGPRDEKAKQSEEEGERERESGSDFMESWKQRSGGQAGGRASEPEGKEGREGDGGGACEQPQPVRGRRGALQGESYPGNTIEGERERETADR